uniref:Uncharacterized protein n=1 Tax=Erpetoichthys calabaricus TaxID=27687 RepID=A0A8C4SHP0_ERPCA
MSPTNILIFIFPDLGGFPPSNAVNKISYFSFSSLSKAFWSTKTGTLLFLRPSFISTPCDRFRNCKTVIISLSILIA